MSLTKSRGAREYSKFRETRHGRTSVAVTNEDEATIETLNVLSSGDTQIVPAPGETGNLTVKGFHFSNRDSSAITVCLKAGTGGKELFSTYLAANGGSFDKNLVGRYWRLPLNKNLVVSLSASGDVLVTVEYETTGEPAQEAVTLTETLALAEEIANIDVSKAIVDSMPIAESLGNLITLGLSDELGIADEEVIMTGDRSKALDDTIGITESLANVTTLSLSDSITFAEGLAIEYTPG